MYILDTNVISALRRPEKEPQVLDWVARIPTTELFTTAITLGEIEQGIRRKERDDPNQGNVLRTWFNNRVLKTFSESKVLPFDLAAARVYGRYQIPELAPATDALIAAIAQANDMTVATRNTRHFEPLGVACINPWERE